MRKGGSRCAVGLWEAGPREALGTSAQILGWTPFGWAWSLPADVARGQWAVAGLHLVLASGLGLQAGTRIEARLRQDRLHLLHPGGALPADEAGPAEAGTAAT